MTPFRENLRGILGIIAANLLFLINDTMIKLASRIFRWARSCSFAAFSPSALLVPIVIAADVVKYVPLLWNASLFWRDLSRGGLRHHPLHPGAVQHSDRQHQRHPSGRPADGDSLRGDLPRRTGGLAALGRDRGRVPRRH